MIDKTAEFEEISLSPLLTAFAKFKDFSKDIITERDRAGAIQAFEYCFELAWKTMRRILEKRGRTTNSPKETFRLAALEGLIDDVEQWFEFLRMRNLTVHTYQESEAEKVVSIFPDFTRLLEQFIKNVGA